VSWKNGNLQPLNLGGGESGELVDADTALHAAEVERLRQELQGAAEVSHLPVSATSRRELNDFLLQVRLAAGR
jgi:hypothetical protein